MAKAESDPLENEEHRCTEKERISYTRITRKRYAVAG